MEVDEALVKVRPPLHECLLCCMSRRGSSAGAVLFSRCRTRCRLLQGLRRSIEALLSLSLKLRKLNDAGLLALKEAVVQSLQLLGQNLSESRFLLHHSV